MGFRLRVTSRNASACCPTDATRCVFTVNGPSGSKRMGRSGHFCVTIPMTFFATPPEVMNLFNLWTKNDWCENILRIDKVFYTVILTAGAFHINTVLRQSVLLSLTILMVLLAAACVVTSVILFVGLCSDNRVLLIPWILSLSLTTLLDIVLSVYLFTDTDYDAVLIILLLVDLLICALNVYCLLCVISQYQEYKAGRGTCRHSTLEQVDSGGRQGGRNVYYSAPPPTPTAFVLEDGISVAHFLLPPSGTKSTPGSSLLPGSRYTNGVLQQELSTISEDPMLHESVRKISTDCSSGRTDSSQVFSSFAERSSFSLPGPAGGSANQQDDEPLSRRQSYSGTQCRKLSTDGLISTKNETKE